MNSKRSNQTDQSARGKNKNTDIVALHMYKPNPPKFDYNGSPKPANQKMSVKPDTENSGQGNDEMEQSPDANEYERDPSAEVTPDPQIQPQESDEPQYKAAPRVIQSKPGGYTAVGPVSKSHNAEIFNKGGIADKTNLNPSGYYYRKPGAPDYFDFERDKKLFGGQKGSLPGAPEVHYQMSCRMMVDLDKYIKENNTRKLEDIMASNIEMQKKEWIESAKLVERLNEDRKKRERDQFKRQ
jgi:hypothetical protein